MSYYRELMDHLESYPQDREIYAGLVNFHFYLHNQDHFIEKLKSLNIADVSLLRLYYKTLQEYTAKHTEFVKQWCTIKEFDPHKKQALLYAEVTNLQDIIFQIIKNQLQWRTSPE